MNGNSFARYYIINQSMVERVHISLKIMPYMPIIFQQVYYHLEKDFRIPDMSRASIH